MALNPSTAITITLWFWIVTGVAGIIFAIYLTLQEDTDDSLTIAATMGIKAGAGGLLSLAVVAAGSPGASLVLWRGTAIIGVVMGLAIGTRVFRIGPAIATGPPGSTTPSLVMGPTIGKSGGRRSAALWTTIIGTVAMMVTTFLSFQSYSIPLSREAINAITRAQASTTITAATGVWISLLIVLAVGITYFLLLFVRRLERGGAPQIETHWGGIGGGLGGWRLSSSLGYLLIAVVLSVVFTIFFLHFQDLARRPAEATVTAEPSYLRRVAQRPPVTKQAPTARQSSLWNRASRRDPQHRRRDSKGAGMPIQIVDFAEPFTEAQRAGLADPVHIKSDAYYQLLHELRRYCNLEISGRSFLVAGHRGSGKTTLVLKRL